jgi:hypothetical protein
LRPSCTAHFKALGKKNEICGKATMRTTHTNMARTKGAMPLNMLDIGTSLAMPAMMNIFMPTGGVISPISIMVTVTVPNQTG